MEMLKEVDNDALTELGVGSGLERKVMLKTIQQVCSAPQPSAGSRESPASPEDVRNHKQLKMKAKQLQSKYQFLSCIVFFFECVEIKLGHWKLKNLNWRKR